MGRVIAAKADAEAMRIKTEALTGNAKLVEYEAVQKWNGEQPETARWKRAGIPRVITYAALQENRNEPLDRGQ